MEMHGDAVEVLWKCCGGAVEVLWKCCGGAVEVLWRSCGGAVGVLRSYGGAKVLWRCYGEAASSRTMRAVGRRARPLARECDRGERIGHQGAAYGAPSKHSHSK